MQLIKYIKSTLLTPFLWLLLFLYWTTFFPDLAFLLIKNQWCSVIPFVWIYFHSNLEMKENKHFQDILTVSKKVSLNYI